MQFYWLILGTLAVWRISYLLSSENGPWNFLAWSRRQFGKTFRTDLASCLYCLSVWIAAPFACFIGGSWKERIVLWPTLSAGAIIVERLVHPEIPTPLYREDLPGENALGFPKEGKDVLREESTGKAVQRS